ncbi:MAG: hypothetical protein AAF551_06375 [Bacteroidota bacterium]
MNNQKPIGHTSSHKQLKTNTLNVFGTQIAKYYNVSTNQRNTNRNKTLIILLGIILAFLLTLNAKSFYKVSGVVPFDDGKTSTFGFFETKTQNSNGNLLNFFTEKFSSLSK